MTTAAAAEKEAGEVKHCGRNRITLLWNRAKYDALTVAYAKEGRHRSTTICTGELDREGPFYGRVRRLGDLNTPGNTVVGGIQLWRGDRLVSCKRTLLSIGRTAPSSGRRNPSRVNSTRKIRIGQKWQRWHRRSGGDEKRRATANPEWI